MPHFWMLGTYHLNKKVYAKKMQYILPMKNRYIHTHSLKMYILIWMFNIYHQKICIYYFKK